MNFKIDQMVLADIGHPRSLAREIQRQMRSQLGALPSRFPLEALATELGIQEISRFSSTSIEGMLVVHGGSAIIGVRAGVNPRRVRFTIAHELGHFTIPTHLGGKHKFECERSDFRAERPRRGLLADIVSPKIRKEIEANEFAAELLVAGEEYATQREKLGSTYSLLHIRELARHFDVSTQMMARIYVERADAKVAVIFSKEGKIRQFNIPKQFPFMGLRANQNFPDGSNAPLAISEEALSDVPELEEIQSHVWFDEDQNVGRVWEQTLLVGNGWAMTLVVPKLNGSGLRDGDEILLRSSDNMRTGEREGRFSWD